MEGRDAGREEKRRKDYGSRCFYGPVRDTEEDISSDLLLDRAASSFAGLLLSLLNYKRFGTN